MGNEYKAILRVDPKLRGESERALSEKLSPQYSDDDLALKFCKEHSDSFRFVSAHKRWMEWNGGTRPGYWREQSTTRVYGLARTICREASLEKDLSESPAMRRRLCSANTVAAVERLAQCDDRVAATAEQWDAEPMQLNVGNGTLDLLTGKLLDHDPENFHTKLAGCEYSEKTPERWLRFLGEIFSGDSEMTKYMQRVVGYCLTGSTREHALFFCHGAGSNGKSVFASTLTGLLGDYAHTAPVETFVETRSDQHPTSKAALRGCRLAVTQEVEHSAHWAESRLKALTGGDRITARYMRQDDFTFTPEFKLLIAGNHRPHLSAVDEAIRRRIHLISFNVVIPEKGQDKRLSEKLRTEWPAILGWAVQGCLDWQRNGLDPPQAVREATKDYLAAEDPVAAWLHARYDFRKWKTKEEKARSTQTYDNYYQWCGAADETPVSQMAFSLDMKKRAGIQPRQDDKGSYFEGIVLKPKEEKK